MCYTSEDIALMSYVTWDDAHSIGSKRRGAQMSGSYEMNDYLVNNRLRKRLTHGVKTVDRGAWAAGSSWDGEVREEEEEGLRLRLVRRLVLQLLG